MLCVVQTFLCKPVFVPEKSNDRSAGPTSRLCYRGKGSRGYHITSHCPSLFPLLFPSSSLALSYCFHLKAPVLLMAVFVGIFLASLTLLRGKHPVSRINSWPLFHSFIGLSSAVVFCIYISLPTLCAGIVSLDQSASPQSLFLQITSRCDTPAWLRQWMWLNFPPSV